MGLGGKRILVTRAAEQAGELCALPARGPQDKTHAIVGVDWTEHLGVGRPAAFGPIAQHIGWAVNRGEQPNRWQVRLGPLGEFAAVAGSLGPTLSGRRDAEARA